MGPLPRERRIRTRKEIGELLASPRARGRALELFVRPARGDASRGTCITPKLGHTSVERNRLRRRLQALIRERLLERGEPRDWLVRARREAYEASFTDLGRELTELAERFDPPTSENDPRTR